MEHPNPADRAARLAEFREKVKSLSIEELAALATILKHSAGELREEMQAIAENIAHRHAEQLRQKHSR